MVWDQLLLALHPGPPLKGVDRKLAEYLDTREDAATMGCENVEILFAARRDDVKEAAWRIRATIVRRRCSIEIECWVDVFVDIAP